LCILSSCIHKVLGAFIKQEVIIPFNCQNVRTEFIKQKVFPEFIKHKVLAAFPKRLDRSGNQGRLLNFSDQSFIQWFLRQSVSSRFFFFIEILRDTMSDKIVCRRCPALCNLRRIIFRFLNYFQKGNSGLYLINIWFSEIRKKRDQNLFARTLIFPPPFLKMKGTLDFFSNPT
jgi:hypothetical protein